MADHYRVVDDTTKTVLFEIDEDGWKAMDWMMEHIDDFTDLHEVYTELWEDENMGGWWSAQDLLEENPDGYWLPGGTVKLVLNDDGETYRREEA